MISLVIPVLQEGPELQCHLPRVMALPGIHEVLVVDGGSTDDSVDVARRLGAKVIHSPPGRGTQMNRGADEAAGDVLLFLHADSWLESGAVQEVERLLGEEGVAAGVFRQRIEGDGRLFRWIEQAASLRSRWLGLPYGDSGLFLRREMFDRAGGFPDIPLCEDLGIARRLRRIGKLVLAESRVHLSPRRWQEKGVTRTTVLNWFVAISFGLGVSPRRLYRTYYGEALPETGTSSASDALGNPGTSGKASSTRSNGASSAGASRTGDWGA